MTASCGKSVTNFFFVAFVGLRNSERKLFYTPRATHFLYRHLNVRGKRKLVILLFSTLIVKVVFDELSLSIIWKMRSRWMVNMMEWSGSSRGWGELVFFVDDVISPVLSSIQKFPSFFHYFHLSYTLREAWETDASIIRFQRASSAYAYLHLATSTRRPITVPCWCRRPHAQTIKVFRSWVYERHRAKNSTTNFMVGFALRPRQYFFISLHS